MNQYREMFEYVRHCLEKQCVNLPEAGMGKLGISYSRYQHIVRVYKWMLRISAQLKADQMDMESLKIATIFHDIGYGMDGEKEPHAKISAKMCQDYLEERNYSHQKVEFICSLIERHSMKRLLYSKNTEIELIVLMEADLLDDTGAQGILIDAWIEAGEKNVSFDSMLRHIKKYTYRHMRQTNLVTAPGKRFWHEKRKLTYEFVRQLERDLGYDELERR